MTQGNFELFDTALGRALGLEGVTTEVMYSNMIAKK